MTAREQYDEMIRSRLGPQLKKESFKRVRNHFARWGGGGWQIIDFQASQWGSRDAVSFTINLACALDGLAKRSEWDEKKSPSEAAAHLRERIGVLLDDGRDRWWDFDAATDPEALAGELMMVLRRVGLPWLEARADLGRVLTLVSCHPERLGWHDLRILPKLLAEAGHAEASKAVAREAERRGSS